MQVAAGDKRKVLAVRLVLPRFDRPWEVKRPAQGSWVPESGRPLPRERSEPTAEVSQGRIVGYDSNRLIEHMTNDKNGILVGARQLVRQDRELGGPFYGAQPLQPTQTRAPTGGRLRILSHEGTGAADRPCQGDCVRQMP